MHYVERSAKTHDVSFLHGRGLQTVSRVSCLVEQMFGPQCRSVCSIGRSSSSNDVDGNPVVDRDPLGHSVDF